MSNSVRLSIANDLLKVSVPKNSPFLTGKHRIYLANVIGLNENDEDNGYYIEIGKSQLSDIVNELVKYFKEANTSIEYDDEVGSIIHVYDEGSETFGEAREFGIQLKSHPPKSVAVPGFQRKLKGYQVPAVAHLVSLRSVANFSVPGSGKTTVALAGFSILKNKGEVNKLVVIGPRAAFMSWEDEYKSCFGKNPKSIRITGSVAIRKQLYRKASNAELILLSYQMASQDENKLAAFLRENKVMLVLDESHYIKRMEGGKWASTVISLAPYAKCRLILSGTPVPNSLEDLYSQMTFLWPNPKILGTTDEYKDRIVTKGIDAAEDIKNELFPFYYRVHKSQLKLKSPKYHRITIKMRPYQQAIYDALAIKLLSEIVKAPDERSKLRAWRKARITRLLQTASNPALLSQYSEEFQIPPIDATGLSISELIERYPKYETPSKIDAVVKLTNELLNKDEKVIIWTSFIHNIKALTKLLKEHSPRIVYGDVPKDANENESFNREKMIRDFKYSSEFNVLIANPSACAESVSLHKICHHAIYLDRTFNCALYMQSLDRIHRIGLEPNEQIHYYIFQAYKSIDEIIDNRLKEKQGRMLELLDDDFAILDLEASYSEISEESEEETDFAAIVRGLKTQYE